MIGIVGLGVIGQANEFGFKKLGHTVVGHDIKLNTKLEDLLKTEVVFICVPTPQKEDGSCDTSIVESVVHDLKSLNYSGIVAIRSTITPGTTEFLKNKFNVNVCFVPEFLRERCAISDFVENNNVLAVGTQDLGVFDTIKKCFGSYPKHSVMMSPTEAELLKYYHNCMNAARVTIANTFYEVCQKLGANYNAIKDGILKSLSLPNIYLDVNDNIRGYGGTCLKKDIPAMNALVKELGLDLKLFDYLEKENAKFKITVFPGMRL